MVVRGKAINKKFIFHLLTKYKTKIRIENINLK